MTCLFIENWILNIIIYNPMKLQIGYEFNDDRQNEFQVDFSVQLVAAPMGLL